jgi:thiosulfate/3-mercaptopyruvate sulfurtransferase
VAAVRDLISPESLAELLPEATVLDVRWQMGRSDGREQYLAGHVPGAAYVDLPTELSDPPAAPVDGRGRHPLPDLERFGRAMRRAGVTTGRPVVVYDDTSGLAAARAWWLLRHHGHDDVRLLDGGWSAWVASGGHVEEGEGPVVNGDFEPASGRLPVLDADGAESAARSGVLLDARAPERFRGDVEPVDPVAGHVPGARNVPTSANLGDGSGARFRPEEELREVYADALRAADSGAVVGVSCGSGVTAAHDAFVLHALGVEAALYAGSWSGWTSDPERPVETGD